MSLWNRPEEKGGCESFGGRERLTMMGRTEDPRLQQEVVGRVSGRCRGSGMQTWHPGGKQGAREPPCSQTQKQSGPLPRTEVPPTTSCELGAWKWAPVCKGDHVGHT